MIKTNIIRLSESNTFKFVLNDWRLRCNLFSNPLTGTYGSTIQCVYSQLVDYWVIGQCCAQFATPLLQLASAQMVQLHNSKQDIPINAINCTSNTEMTWLIVTAKNSQCYKGPFWCIHCTANRWSLKLNTSWISPISLAGWNYRIPVSTRSSWALQNFILALQSSSKWVLVHCNKRLYQMVSSQISHLAS